MNSVLFYKPPLNLTSRARGQFQTASQMTIFSSSSATQGTISQRKDGGGPLRTNTEPRQFTEPILCLPQSGTQEEESMAKKEYQFVSKNCSVVTDGDDDDFEIPELHDLFMAVDQEKNERKARGGLTDDYHELTERERDDILVAARNIRNERLQSQRMSPELAVNEDRVEKSREVAPGDSQENPITFSDDDDDGDDNDDGENNERMSNGTDRDTQVAGNSKESSLEAASTSPRPRRDDIPQATQKDIGERAEQPLGDFSQISAKITEAGQEPEDETVGLYAAYQSSALSKANPFEGHDKCATSPAAAPSVSLPQSAAVLDYVRRLSRERRDQYTPLRPRKLGIHVERQHDRPTHGPPPEISELQCRASIEPEHHSLSGAEEDDRIGDYESPTEPATPCFCVGGSRDCGARQHETIEQTEPSPQPEPVVPQQVMFRRAPGPSPSPDEARYSSVDASLQRSLSSRKRSHPVEDDTPLKRSRRTRKETWKVREAREMAALLDSLD